MAELTPAQREEMVASYMAAARACTDLGIRIVAAVVHDTCTAVVPLTEDTRGAGVAVCQWCGEVFAFDPAQVQHDE